MDASRWMMWMARWKCGGRNEWCNHCIHDQNDSGVEPQTMMMLVKYIHDMEDDTA